MEIGTKLKKARLEKGFTQEKVAEEKSNFNRPTVQRKSKFDIRYGLPTLFHRVELAFVQQSKKHTYQFTGSQRECSFMLMGSHLIKFLVIKSLYSGQCIITLPMASIK